MKKLLPTLLLSLLLVSNEAYSQTNSFPSTGNAKIFAAGEAWAEGLTIVRPSSWSGVRFTRNDPAGGNYNGNWAIGYNENTGNDFSISTNYNGTQYDGILHLSNSTRYVGIGTTAPNSRLEINTSLPMQGTYESQNWSTNNSGYGLKLQTTWDNNGIGQRFIQRSNGTDYQVLSFLSGNVGIGTTNPGSYKLAVEGKIGAREVNVIATNPWPDYVFDKNYKLPSLEEIKNYIDQNQHLPEVPSAKEVEKNGVNLGEMNALLLKKIEELTLYVIELKKENENAKTQMGNMQSEINKLKK